MACNCRATVAESVDANDLATPCGECRVCRKIESGTHPDVIHIKPTGSLIRIAQIRELCRTLAMRPYEAHIRVVVISDAQTMNPEASNALLKLLEEPPDRTVLILTTNQASDLLPTIVSRCQRIRFKPITQRRLAEMLAGTAEIDPANARVIAAMANGSFTDAVDMSRTTWLAKRNWLIREMASLDGQSVDRLLALAEKMAADKDTLLLSLDVIMSWLRDLAIYQQGPQRMINQDLEEQIRQSARSFTTDAIMRKIKAIQCAQKEIAGNANIRLATETLILQLSRAGNAESVYDRAFAAA